MVIGARGSTISKAVTTCSVTTERTGSTIRSTRHRTPPSVSDVIDLDLLLAQGPIADGVTVLDGVNNQFDLNGEGVIDLADVDLWLADAAMENGFASPYYRGDANLDGRVNAGDLNAIGLAWRSTMTTNWSDGDFNGDGRVNAVDLNELGLNWRRSSGMAVAVPEPAGMVIWLGLVVVAVLRRPLSNCVTRQSHVVGQ